MVSTTLHRRGGDSRRRLPVRRTRNPRRRSLKARAYRKKRVKQSRTRQIGGGQETEAEIEALRKYYNERYKRKIYHNAMKMISKRYDVEWIDKEVRIKDTLKKIIDQHPHTIETVTNDLILSDVTEEHQGRAQYVYTLVYTKGDEVQWVRKYSVGEWDRPSLIETVQSPQVIVKVLEAGGTETNITGVCLYDTVKKVKTRYEQLTGVPVARQEYYDTDMTRTIDNETLLATLPSYKFIVVMKEGNED